MRQDSRLSHLQFSKRQVRDTVTFACQYIPQLDKATLEKFLELVSTGGTAGNISAETLVRKMTLLLKFVPSACPHSLLTLAELLEVPASEMPSSLPQPSSSRLMPMPERRQAMPSRLAS